VRDLYFAKAETAIFEAGVWEGGCKKPDRGKNARKNRFNPMGNESLEKALTRMVEQIGERSNIEKGREDGII